ASIEIGKEVVRRIPEQTHLLANQIKTMSKKNRRVRPLNKNTMLIAGHARLPQGMAAKSIFGTLTITAEVDRRYGVILEATVTLATEHGSNFISRLLRGTSLNDGVDEQVAAIKHHYRGKAANALIAALKDLGFHFQQNRESAKENSIEN